MRRLRVIIACCLLGSAAGAYLVSSAEVSGRFVFERVPSDRRPIEIFVDTESVTGVADPRAVTQDLMNQWNSVSGAEVVFGNARIGGPYNGSTVGETFGTFTNSEFEVAFDDTGEIFGFFGVSPGVLGITLKSVDTGSGRLLDFLVVINTRPSALSDPGSGATSEELFRSTLLHELGHTLGLSHTAVGLANTNSFGFSRAAPSQMPSMYAFRIPIRPQEGMTLEGDDTAAVVRNYPAGTGVAGSISGSVRTAGGTPVNTIHVRAVGPEGGTIEHIGVLTNEDGREQGRYTIEGVPPGVYRVILETVNGRAAIDGGVLAGGSDGLGSEPFVYAADEHWQPGDTFDPAFDDPAEFALIRVRPGGDTGSINFVLNGAPIFDGQQLDRELDTGDTQVPDQVGGFHFADYYVFQGSSGQDVTITAESADFVPQLRLFSPADMSVVALDLPPSDIQARIDTRLNASGIFTILVSARATTGHLSGRGDYLLVLQGAGSGLPPPPTPAAASITTGPADPGSQQFASPVCSLPLLQVRVSAPSHEELWVDRVTLHGSGSGDDRLDVDRVRLIEDLDHDGRVDSREPTLATLNGGFAANDGTLVFDNAGLEFDAGTTTDLLVVYDITVQSVSSAGVGGMWWALPLLALLYLIRRRHALLLLCLLAVVPLSCSGGGGGSNCVNQPFDPDGAVATFSVRIEAGGMEAFTPTQDPGTPLGLPTAALSSGTLSVSN